MKQSFQTILSLGLGVTFAPVALAYELPSSAFGIPGNATFDYVVVGGGTAGNTIAARLAAAGKSVAVIEAGGWYETDNGNGSVIPGLATVQYTGWDPKDTQPLIDWGFVTTPQAGGAGRVMHYASGKTLGGGSARNYLTYHRGTSGAYQRWADEVDDQSYTFGKLLPYFDRSVTLTPPNTAARFRNATVRYNASAFNPSTFHQPLRLTWGNWAPASATWLQKAMAALGIRAAEDFSSGTLDGYAWAPSTIEPGTQYRDSSETSFLKYAIDNTTSIQVYPHTLATKILFDANKTATGVVVETAGEEYVLCAKKEVIVAAGAFRSPQLLMVSGVGPAKTLKQYDIPVLADLPGVGQNMWDQPLGFGVSYRMNMLTATNLIISPAYYAAAISAFDTNGTGPLASAPAFLTFERLSDSAPHLLKSSTLAALHAAFPPDWPEIEILAADAYLGYNTGLDPGPLDGYQYASFVISMLTPFSRGNVTISSASMADLPVVDPAWLTADEDKDLAVAAFRRVRQIGEEIEKLGGTVGGEYFPGPNVTSDADILAYIQRSFVPTYHASGTCKMGVLSKDPLAVVDAQARVYGVQGLRVVDASAFPFLPPGHPVATVYMLAEKVAEQVLQTDSGRSGSERRMRE